MDELLKMTVQELKDAGYAIVLWTPKELNGISPENMESQLISEGWDYIHSA
jgi:hypothetical protein